MPGALIVFDVLTFTLFAGRLPQPSGLITPIALLTAAIAVVLFARREATARRGRAQLEQREDKLREVIAERDRVVRGMTSVHEDLRRSEERFQVAARATRDVIWEWNLRNDRVWVNDAYATGFGYKRAEELSADVWRAAIHPDDRESVLESLHVALQGTLDLWSRQYRYATAGGEWRHVRDRGSIVRDETGVALRVIGVMGDVTDQIRAQNKVAVLHRRNEMILNSVAEGIFEIGLDGGIRFANEAGALMLERTPFEVVGKELVEVLQPARTSSELGPGSLILSTNATIRNKDTFCRRDGSSVPVEYSGRPIIDEWGQVTGAVVTFTDISERLEVERMKDEFVSTVSHELRTPLTSIRGALGLLASGRMGSLPEKGQHLIQIASSNTDRLVRLINDILDIERMELGKVTLSRTRCEAATLLRNAVDVVRTIAERQHITITTEAVAELPLFGDGDRLIQTLTNLLGNSLKFSPAGSTIRLAAGRKDDHAVFTVADEGRGIPADKLQSIFERFQQVDASDSREKGGSGLGLAICRSIVRQHGGSISVESEPGKGSTFTFTIPTGLNVVEPALRSEKRVVVCDADEATRHTLHDILVRRGYEVVEVACGADLLGVVRAHPPDAVLIDVAMPGMNGWEALSQLKSTPETATVPVVIVSVLSPEATGNPVIDLSGWIPKPLDEDAVAEVLKKALPDAAHSRVVLVEDDLDLARVIITSFERYGIETVHAVNGSQAIRLAGEIVPDLLVLDLILPEVDGFGVVDWLKDHDVWSSVPLVVYSALETTPSQKERLRLGTTEFLTKSRISPDEFEQRVVSLLDRLTERREETAHVA